MIVDLTRTDVWPESFDLTIEPAEMDLGASDFRLKTTAKSAGNIEKHAGWFRVEGLIAAVGEIDCSRCLEPVERNVSIPFDIRLLQTEQVEKGSEKAIEPSDLDTSPHDRDEIDLVELVREQIVLDIPEQVFCREDCKGLCIICGANRNLIDCKCEDKEIDPRWAALRNLK